MAYLSNDTLRQILDELKPYVIVVGSYASGKQTSASDIDLYIKEKTEDATNCEDGTYINEIIEIFEKYNVMWDSRYPCSINSLNLPIMLDTSVFFNLEDDAKIETVNILGVELDSTTDTYK